ncbi:ABC transporter ATP-binding protein [Pyrodictium abyssi]|uniref:ABC transporter ATP-binding protein n=1 Tax=Pyrodictium abyssi TaxID=54256 RepID=A0ABM8IXC3_9CREN|nr:ABC transporter ATP-binding protein [Pyrodictium abyssi]
MCREVVVRLRGVYKYYGEKIAALRGVDLEVCRGEFVAIVGPSGSGKSTLISLVAGLDRPDSGYVEVLGERISGWPPGRRAVWRRRSVGIVFQFYHLFPLLTVLENVVLPMKLAGVFRGRERERALELLELVGMKDKAGRYPGELSGGEQQRVAIARALANDPPLILADEPTANLDTLNKRRVVELLEEVHEMGKTVVLTTHDPGLAGRADRLVCLVDGAVVRCGGGAG